ncbi:histidinol dehydrogenase [Chloroflexota bacterium]
MKIIEGFEAAKVALSRQDPSLETLQTDVSEQAVRQIIDEVRRRGDDALLEYTRKFDGVELDSLEITAEQVKAAYNKVDAKLLTALKLAAERITTYHTAQKESLLKESVEDGLGWLVRPLERVGIYVPGGMAYYPSTALMTAIPARVVGVKDVIMVTPPRKDGTVHPITLVAADIAGVDRVFSVGGAQAIAALAFGTESIPAVDKICGPGNVYVQLAKREVYGVVGIDGFQGSSEVLIIADETANPEYCAADLLAQAEHDPLASAVLVTTSQRKAEEVNRAVKEQLSSLKRQEIATKALENQGMIAVVASMDEAIELVNMYAPEHLLLMVDKADSYLDRISNTGCIVLGEKATVALGDYVAGPSHVLPTGGTARFSSPLNVTDFVKMTSLINVDDASLKQLGPAAQTLANAEGLDAHAKAVEKRLKAD